MKKNGDLAPFLLNVNSDTTLQDLYETICGHYLAAISWYLTEKEGKGRRSKLLRLFTIVFAVVGGAVPLIATVIPQLNESIGYVLLALAGGLQLFDRYFGYSSAWSRYVGSAMDLNAQLLMFQVEHARLTVRAVEEDEQWTLLHQYAERLATVVSAETTTWSTEFTDNVRQLARRHSAERGTL